MELEGTTSKPLPEPLTTKANAAALGLSTPAVFVTPVMPAALDQASATPANEIHITRGSNDPFSCWLIGEGDRKFGAPQGPA